MDSLTHIALGACIAEAMPGKTLGKKGLLLGAIAQNLPDIDGLANLWLSPSAGLLAHRGLTHALPVGLAAAAALAMLMRSWPRARAQPGWYWFVFFAVQFSIHDLLDTTNAYGTGLLEPFSHERFTWHLLYVVDPLFTLPVLGVALVVLGFTRRQAVGQLWAVAGLGWALGYVGYAFVSKAIISQPIQQSLSAAHIPRTRFFATPTPFNTMLWYVVTATGKGYYAGYRSVFEKPDQPTHFTFFPRQEHLLNLAIDSVEVARLLRFADGFYTVERTNNQLAINVLRFGQMGGWQQPNAPFTFHYLVDRENDERLVTQRGRFTGWNRETIRAYGRRIVNRQ